PVPVSVPPRARLVLRQGLFLPVHQGRGRRPDPVDPGRDLERREVRRAAAPPRRTGHLSGVPALLQGRALARAGGRAVRRGCRGSRAPGDPADGDPVSATRLGHSTLLVNPPLINGIAFTRQGRCQEREEVLGTTKPPYTLALAAALLRDAGSDVRLIDATADRLTIDAVIARLEGERFTPSLIIFPSTTPTLDADVAAMTRLKRRYAAPLFCFGP